MLQLVLVEYVMQKAIVLSHFGLAAVPPPTVPAPPPAQPAAEPAAPPFNAGVPGLSPNHSVTVGSCVVSENVAYNGDFIGNFSSTTAADCAAKCRDYASGFPPSEIIFLVYPCVLSRELHPKHRGATGTFDILDNFADSGSASCKSSLQVLQFK